jgi:magnesium transporter
MYLLTSALEAAKMTPSGTLLLNQATGPAVFSYVFSGGDSQLQRWSSLIGIVTAIIGNILISFALNIQRYAHIKLDKEWAAKREKARNAAKQAHVSYSTTVESGSNGNLTARESEPDDDEEDDPLQMSFHSTDSRMSSRSYERQENDSNYLRSPYWWGGIVLMTVGEAGNFLAYGFAPASIVSPLGVVALISNCVIAPIMLKEQFRMRDFWGVFIAVAGAVTVVLSSKQQEKKLGPHEVWDAITTMEFEVYVAITVLLIAVLVWASPRYGSRTILIDLGLVGLFGKP